MILFPIFVYQAVRMMKVFLILLHVFIGDLLDCEFSRRVLYWPRIHSLVRSLLVFTPSQITLSDVNYIVEGKTEEDMIGICIALGYMKVFKMIDIELFKLKLGYCQVAQWQSQPNQTATTQIEINYRIEAAVVLIWLLN